MHKYVLVLVTVPEIIALPLTKGFKNYLNWIDRETKD